MKKQIDTEIPKTTLATWDTLCNVEKWGANHSPTKKMRNQNNESNENQHEYQKRRTKNIMLNFYWKI